MWVSNHRSGSRAAASAQEPQWPRFPGPVLRSVTSPYGMIVWGGTIEIVFLQTVGSIRHGPNAPPNAGTVIRVVPVVTLAGTCVDSPFARVNSAAREQFPSVIVHQFLVMG